GKVYQKGVYIYPLVVFLLKTTPQLLILFTLFLIKKYYKYQLVLQVSLITILAFFIIVVIGNYNIGQRHLLPVFPLIALVSSVTFYTLIKGTKNFFLKYGVIVTLGVLCMFSAITPDSIAYITPVVGPVIGGNIIGESNFDWGQSLPILAQEVSNIDYLASSSIADPRWYGIHAKPIPTYINNQEISGKRIAISRTVYIKAYFNKLQIFAEKKATYVADGTFLLFQY
ncbi:MAG: hypothetical protein KGJ07_02890, partial [Patescibacteria group bacterium]|nr:hypothetical protein [Patescibacteria group bacterium]